MKTLSTLSTATLRPGGFSFLIRHWHCWVFLMILAMFVTGRCLILLPSCTASPLMWRGWGVCVLLLKSIAVPFVFSTLMHRLLALHKPTSSFTSILCMDSRWVRAEWLTADAASVTYQFFLHPYWCGSTAMSSESLMRNKTSRSRHFMITGVRWGLLEWDYSWALLTYGDHNLGERDGKTGWLIMSGEVSLNASDFSMIIELI